MWRLLIALLSRKRETKGVCPALGGGSGGGGHGNRGESLKEEDEVGWYRGVFWVEAGL